MPHDVDAITQRVSDYKATFQGVVPERVLADLERFCRANKTTHVVGDPYGSAQLEGRRQVVLYIRDHLNADLGKIRQFIDGEIE